MHKDKNWVFFFADQGCYDAIKRKLLKLSSVTSTDVNDRSTLDSTSTGGNISTTNRNTIENSRYIIFNHEFGNVSTLYELCACTHVCL